MADIFYQGEDMTLQIELFEDDAMTRPQSLATRRVDLLLYTKHDGPTIRLSTDPADADTLTVERESDTALSAAVPGGLSRKLAPGVLTVEMMITDGADAPGASRRIAVGAHIHIEPSKIGML